MIEESDDDDEVLSNFGGKNSTDDLSELDDKMETQSINDNFRNAFILPLELITILFERNMLLLFYQWVSYFLESHPVSIKNLSYKTQIIVAKNSLLDVFES